MEILILEDDPVVQRLLTKQLESFGTPIVASDASTARELIAQRSFSLGIIDIGLPGDDGLDVLEAIRMKEKEQSLPAMPVIMVTGSNESADRAQAESFEVFAYVVKPLDIGLLQKHIKAALGPTKS